MNVEKRHASNDWGGEHLRGPPAIETRRRMISKATRLPVISTGNRWAILAFLLAVYTCQVVDRSVLIVILEPIKREFHLTDSQLGLLAGLAYGIPYSIAGIPLGMLADRINRKRLLAALLGLWSCLTVLSGMAHGFGSLLAARIGLGAAESGCQPISLSLIADYFKPEHRGTATGLLFLGSAIGLLLGLSVAGLVTSAHGWRASFFVAGSPGLLLAIAVALFVREPLRNGSAPRSLVIGPAPSLIAVLRFISRQNALLHMVGMLVLTYTTTSAFVIWLSSYFIRAHGMNIKEAGFLLAMSVGVAGGIGTIGAAWTSDRIRHAGEHRPAMLLAFTTCMSTLAAAGMLIVPSTKGAIIFLMIWGLFNGAWYGPSYSFCLALVMPRMRATTAALILVISNVVGAGLGPQLVGFMSDRFAVRAGSESLRCALLVVLILSLFAIYHCLRAAGSVSRDLARVETV
jgi:predicted MFS family arabinose efflux permease